MKWKDKTDLLAWCEQNGERGQQLIEEWNEDKNFNEYGMPVVMQDFSCFSNKKVWWKCSKCGHEWQVYVRNRTQQNANCSVCANKKRAYSNETRYLKLGHSLSEWCRKNGEWGKLLLDEWDYEKNKEEYGLEPEQVTYASKKKVYWVCRKCKSSFKMNVTSRTSQLSLCTRCSSNGTSYPEQFILHALKQIFPKTLSREKLFGGIEYDIVVPEEKLCIEYNGGYWHKEKSDRDNMKEQLCVGNGYRFIRVEDSTDIDVVCMDGNCIKTPKKGRVNNYYHLQEVVKYIIMMLGKENVYFNSILADKCAMEVLYKGENQLEKDFPELLKEWGDERNPKFYNSSSHVKIAWCCTKCNKMWHSTIADRVRMRTGCVNCGYNIFDGRIHNHAIRRKYQVFTLCDFV